jgi:hypothetical protein
VEAELALDEGRTADAIELLQYSEATFNPLYNSLRLKVQKLLASLGARPLMLTPEVPYTVTPLP